MAKSKRGGGARPLAIEMLEADHRKVEALFDQYEEEKEGDEETKRAISQRICGELTVHAQVEEELFYPWLRENLDEEDMEGTLRDGGGHVTPLRLLAGSQTVARPAMLRHRTAGRASGGGAGDHGRDLES